MNDANLRRQLGSALAWGDAHVTLEKAVSGIPPRLRGVVPSGLCPCKQAPSFVQAVTALPSCASCVTMLPSAETSRDSQVMSSSRSEQSAARETCGAPTFRLAQ